MIPNAFAPWGWTIRKPEHGKSFKRLAGLAAISAIVPERRGNIVSPGAKTFISGPPATPMSGTPVGA